MRNWPYAYAAGNGADSPVKGTFDVAPLPHDPGQPSVGTVGGWQLGVSKYSRNPDAAIEFVRYLTSPQVETWRAIVGSYVPTIPSVAADPQVIAAAVDGATAAQRFFSLTLPLLRPAILVALIFRTVDALRVFDVFFVMFGRGPICRPWPSTPSSTW
jgi:ABC-type glycerol-3-phosphate transport system substrate-binding protein